MYAKSNVFGKFFDRDARRSGPTIHFDDDPTSSLWKLIGAYKLDCNLYTLLLGQFET